MIEQSFTTRDCRATMGRTVEPLSSTAHREEPKTIEAIAHREGCTCIAV